MNSVEHFGWDRLRHGGLLLDTPRLNEIYNFTAEPLPFYIEQQLRRQVDALFAGSADVPAFVTFVLDQICGFSPDTGIWHRGNQIGPELTRRAVTGEAVKPRQLWQGSNGGRLPVFFDSEKRVGIGRGRKTVSQVLQWLRTGTERLAVITNGRQWRLLFAGLDFEAWCEWDVDLWLEEGTLSPQVLALRTLLSPALWSPPKADETPLLLQAILDSRKGQAELSAVLGERVREAVEIMVQTHGEVLKERCAAVHPSDIYRAAVRVVMRIVVALFAESRELLPRDNTLYHGAYGVTGLRESLEKQAARGSKRLARSWSAWPRVIGLFRLIYQGSHHKDLMVPEYGGELFAPGDPHSSDGMTKVLSVFETACFDRELMSDKDVLRLLGRITRTRVKVRHGRGSIWVPAPVDFSDLSSEYIGILYEGLLDFELKTAPAGDSVVFLAIGNQPALPLSRLEAMDDRALANLLEKMKDTSSGEDKKDGTEENETADEALGAEEDTPDETEGDEEDVAMDAAEAQDVRHTTRTRAETWARKAVTVGKLVPKPRGSLTPEKRLVYEEKISRKAHQLVSRVVLPGEWYLVLWGGTRKGSGTFYTRPGLAVPTVQRTLKPLAYTPPTDTAGNPDRSAPADAWSPKKPEEILALKVCDPACGSGTFPVAALRYMTDAVFAALYHHGRIREDGERAIVALIKGEDDSEEYLCQEMLPCRPDDPIFESRLKAVLRRHVVERCLYGVDLDPLAVELCRLSLWIETMDRDLPFSFLDHKVKCGNSLVGAWFDQFQHYPVMAWKNREGGDKNHTNGVHYEKGVRSKDLKAFVKDGLTPDLLDLIENRVLFNAEALSKAKMAHEEALKTFSRIHDLPVHESDERARVYREKVVGSEAYRALKREMDLWCACWFWPADQIEQAPRPTIFSKPSVETRNVAERIAASKRFFHWPLEFPDVFRKKSSGFDAVMGNPPWETLQPSSMEFFSNIDPLYRSYGKQEALRFQTTYFEDRKTECEWLDYTDDFACDSNWMKFAGSPFGDPEGTTKSSDRFSIVRGKRNNALHDRWKVARKKSVGYASSDHPFHHRGEGKAYTYKLFLEYAHHILGEKGRLGFIVPSGIYSDLGTEALRDLFLNHCRWEWLFGFENRDKVFQIDSRFKFNPVIIEKGGRTEAIQTAFMRRKLEDWEHGEIFATPYGRDQVTRFSPKSRAILEIQSSRDLEILEKIYSNSVLLGDDGPDGWGIKYAQGDFNTTSDSKLFPPRPNWEERGYRPDEYSRWIKGDWRPVEELWEELSVEPLKEGEIRCAQPPYDRLPIPRSDIPVGIIFSRNTGDWIWEDEIENTALPFYEGRMIGQFDFSQKGWVSGKGRGAVWEEISWENKIIAPQFLMSKYDCESNSKCPWFPKLSHMRVGSATNERSAVSCAVVGTPTSDTAAIFWMESWTFALSIAGIFNSFIFDYITRNRLVGLHLDYHVFAQNPLPKTWNTDSSIDWEINQSLLAPSVALTLCWTGSLNLSFNLPQWRSKWALTQHERKRLRAKSDAIIMALYGISCEDAFHILKDCDLPPGIASANSNNPKGFWRVDKNKDPELRHTVLTLVAFHDLEEKIRACGGNREKGIEAFVNQNDGEGWMLPETLRLADYGLGHDARAKEHHPVATRLGPRFYDWQLAQSPEESWCECHLHARNLLGKNGYLNLIGEVLRDTAPGGWRDALKFACDLEEKQSLIRVFSIALGFLSPEVWEARLNEARMIALDQEVTFELADKIQVIVGALKKIAKESRPEGIAAAKGILGETDFIIALERLLAALPRRADHPWHKIIRQQVGESVYQKITADLEMETPNQVAKEQANYSPANIKGTQRGLFD